MDLFDKIGSFQRAKELQAAGLYPYFRPIQSATGPEVIIDGRNLYDPAVVRGFGLEYSGIGRV